MADKKSWDDMTFSEQESATTELQRRTNHELWKAKLSVLESMQTSNNIHVTVGAAQAYALLSGKLSSTTSPNRS